MKIDISSYADPSKVGGFTNCVEGEDWILWEHENGSIHISRTNGMGKGVVGEMIVIEAPI